VLAIDPGRHESAYAFVEANEVGTGLLSNARLLSWLYKQANPPPTLVVERMNFMPNHCGDEVHETNVFAGRCLEAYANCSGTAHRIYRRVVAVHTTGATRGDATIRAALIDRFGGKDKAIGGTRCSRCKGKMWTGRDHIPCRQCDATGWKYPKGLLYGVVTHCWQALALGLAYLDGVELADE
jgi:hypothetical protein